MTKYHLKWAMIGPPVKRHLNNVSLVGRWWPNIECWLCDFQAIQTSFAKKPYIFFYFSWGGGGGSGLVPRLDPSMSDDIHKCVF